jgi:group I intron endonuclease
MGSIYKITNSKNNKIYIGQTVGDVNKRFKKHLSQINCKNVCSALYSAFSKYGKENFIIETIVNGDYTKEELNELEVFYIKEYNSMSPNGYNLQSGGNSFIVAESVKIQISESLKGREITWKDKVSDGLRRLWKNEEYRNKQTLQRHNKRGKYNTHSKPLRLILDINLINEMYKNGDTIAKIARHFNCSHSVIKKRINYEN